MWRGTGSLDLVGLYLAPYAGIAFIWFLAVARSRIEPSADRFFDTVFLGSGVLLGAMMSTTAAQHRVIVLGGGGCPKRRSPRTQGAVG